MISQAVGAFIARYAGDAWAALAPNEPVLRRIFTHDPNDNAVNPKHLPALYVFPAGSWKDAENLTDDLRITYDRIMAAWVLPPTEQFKQAVRSRGMRIVAKLIDSAIERGRDPSFIVPGDDDPQAQVEGSVLIRFAGLLQLYATRWMPGQIAIRDADEETGKKHTLYPAVMSEIRIAEQFNELPTAVIPPGLGPTAPLYAPPRVDLTITSNGSDSTAVEYRDPKTGWTP